MIGEGACKDNVQLISHSAGDFLMYYALKVTLVPRDSSTSKIRDVWPSNLDLPCGNAIQSWKQALFAGASEWKIGWDCILDVGTEDQNKPKPPGLVAQSSRLGNPCSSDIR